MFNKLIIKITVLLLGAAIIFSKQHTESYYDYLVIALPDLAFDERFFYNKNTFKGDFIQPYDYKERKMSRMTTGSFKPVIKRKIYQAPGDAFSCPPIN